VFVVENLYYQVSVWCVVKILFPKYIAQRKHDAIVVGRQ
jgi:hypothetical protein